ncbi:tubulin---tyrosine ligase [Angomonas deanei]|nr:tubulin---tyrosine ligase [Angomonas deanei]|eukprot:EPY39885.1 tubulin---tyrosine ligase [Angomonas deanei]
MSEAKVGKLFVGNTTFSVYVEMTRQLEEEGWVRITEESRVGLCDLVLGDRKSIPYAILRVEPMAPDSFFNGKRWVNYFLRSNHLTMKTFMAETLKAMDRTCGAWMPETYIIGGNQKLKKDDRETLLQVAEAAPDAIWIVKPGSGAKGKGIYLSKGAEKLQELITNHKETSRTVYAVQRYLERPLLLSHRRKFDLRTWVFLTSPYSIYAFTQVSCRTASVPFDLGDIDNLYAHLTNHCLQESHPDYSKYEEGNELWLPELEQYLIQEKGEAEGVLHEKVLPRIADLIVRTMLSMRPEMQVYPDEGYDCSNYSGTI